MSYTGLNELTPKLYSLVVITTLEDFIAGLKKCEHNISCYNFSFVLIYGNSICPSLEVEVLQAYYGYCF